MKFLSLVIASLTLLVSPAGFAQEQESILVSHQATLDLANLVSSKKEAQEKAMIKALMIASQNIANPSLLSRNETLLFETFAQSPTSFIKDYTFVEQKTRGDQYLVRLQVEPKWYYLKNKLTDWGFLGFQSKPSLEVSNFMVDASAVSDVTSSVDYWTETFTRQLTSMGMVVKEPQSSLVPHYTVQVKILRGQGKLVEFVYQISSDAQAAPLQHVFTAEKPMEENLMAGMLALEVIEHVMPIWFETQGNQRIYEVKLQNINQHVLLKNFKQMMTQQRGVIQSIEDKSYMAGAAVFQVRVLQDDLHFSSYLSGLQVDGRPIQVVGQSGRQIVIEIP